MTALPEAQKLWAMPAELIKQWASDPNKQTEEQIILTCLRPYLGEGDAVADLGCGVGRYAEVLAILNIDYFGFDASEQMIEAARASNHTGFPTFQHGDILECSDATYYDLCLLVDVLIHHDEPAKAFEKIIQLWDAHYFMATLLVGQDHQNLFNSTVLSTWEFTDLQIDLGLKVLHDSQVVGENFHWVVVLAVL